MFRIQMSTSEIMRTLIPAVPSLNLSTTLKALQSGPFESTVVSSKLKDATGKPIEAKFWYQPSLDTDRQRRESLMPFAKQVRKATKASKQYYWAKVR
jgi:hypothetical protein